jgi:hypothetical protein
MERPKEGAGGGDESGGRMHVDGWHDKGVVCVRTCLPTMLNVRACCDDMVQHRQALEAQGRNNVLKVTSYLHARPRDGANA